MRQTNHCAAAMLADIWRSADFRLFYNGASLLCLGPLLVAINCHVVKSHAHVLFIRAHVLFFFLFLLWQNFLLYQD